MTDKSLDEIISNEMDKLPKLNPEKAIKDLNSIELTKSFRHRITGEKINVTEIMIHYIVVKDEPGSIWTAEHSTHLNAFLEVFEEI